MSKDLYFDYSEQEVFENPPLEIEEENNEFKELMQRLYNKQESLSYSSLKKFAESPRHFLQYKLQTDFKQSPSMLFGSICDLKLTEPHKFDLKYAVVKNTPNTDNQIGFCNSILNGSSPEEAKKINNPRGDAQELFLLYEDYINALKSNKTIIDVELDELSTKIVDNLKKSELVMQYIDSCTEFQKKESFEYNKWKINTIKDGVGNRIILDFKFATKCDTESFERDIKKFRYYLQAGIYCKADEGVSEYYFIAYDKNLNFNVIKLDYSYIHYGIREFEYLVKKLEDCIYNNRWSESYNFFDVQQSTVFKPKWIKGFETDALDIE